MQETNKPENTIYIKEHHTIREHFEYDYSKLNPVQSDGPCYEY